MRSLIPVFFILFTVLIPGQHLAQNQYKIKTAKIERKIKTLFKKPASQQKKIVAVALDLSMGFLGVHRLYMGTSTKVPVIYAVTLGGGGFLVLTDLIIIITSKDFEKYTNNDHVLMWNVNE